VHKGYCTPVHDAALTEHGPSAVHRYSFVNVRTAVMRPPVLVHNGALPVGTSDTGVEGGEEP